MTTPEPLVTRAAVALAVLSKKLAAASGVGVGVYEGVTACEGVDVCVDDDWEWAPLKKAARRTAAAAARGARISRDPRQGGRG